MHHYMMRYESNEKLDEWFESFSVCASDSVLFQIFSGIIDPNLLRRISEKIAHSFPNATIIGTTTAGEIQEGKILEKSIVISLSVFRQTKLKSIHLAGIDSETMGREAARAIVNTETKCVIIFADGLQCAGDDILYGFDSVCSHEIIIAGGMSGDNNLMAKTYCIHGTDVFEGGVVAVSLSSSVLKVFYTYNLSWLPIGREMTITKAEGNIVYEIDNTPVLDIYAHYLGDEVIRNMPGSMIEFPLIYQEGGIDIARSTLGLSGDGGVMFAGNMIEGKNVRFGIGSPDMICKGIKTNYDLAIRNPIEGIFVYSCTGRKIFLGNNLEAEFTPLASIAPLGGFFTYGEFYHESVNNKLLNMTTTVLGLSETDEVKEKKDIKGLIEHNSRLTINALMNLVGAVMNEEKEKLETELTERNNSMRQLSHAFQQSPNTIVITDIFGNTEYVNDAFVKTTGYTKDEAIGKNLNFLWSGKTPQNVFENMLKHLKKGDEWSGEFINRSKYGNEYIVAVRASPVFDADGSITHYVVIKEDITDKKSSEDRIYYLANFDFLTGLPNRKQLEDRFNLMLLKAKQSKNTFAVLFLDIDNFKEINDSLGHGVGDALLVLLAKRLKTISRKKDTVSRMGGDEFVLLLFDTNLEEAGKAALKILEIIKQPFVIEQHELTISASIGISMYPMNGLSLEVLLQNADTAMYHTKKYGRNDYSYFTDEMQAKSLYNLQLSNALHHALDRNEFHMVYQPQISIRTGRIIGVEALLRWNHPQFGNVPPSEFIPIAEANGSILPIGEWIFHNAIYQLKAWMDKGLPAIVIAVNLSAVQFRQRKLVEMIDQILNEADMSPEYLEIELTENITMNDQYMADRTLGNLHKKGIRLSIDDFGTGYSSLSNLKKFKIDKLKIDQSFILDIDTNPEDKAIAETIINMAHTLGMYAIAEGVENIEHFEHLREMGCDEAQGCYVSKPLSSEEFLSFARSHFAKLIMT